MSAIGVSVMEAVGSLPDLAWLEALTLTPRVLRLRERLEAEFAHAGRHMVVNPDECETYARLAVAAYSQSVEQPEILRRAEFLLAFATDCPATRRADELIVGSQRFTQPPFHALFSAEQLRQAGIHRNHGHIIVDYERVLRQGLPGLRRAVEAMSDGVNRDAFCLTLDAFATFVRRHGWDELATRPPVTFHEALQMTWFIQLFLSAEGLASALSFGRLDQFLWPYLERDLAAGRCDPQAAYELVCCFFLKCCEGAESQNLTLGGAGQENPLSLMALRAMRAVQLWQPSLSVRIDPHTSEGFWHEALQLCTTGTGMPAFFNEAVVTAALRRLDIPADRASDWGIVGCYEASPQGDAYPLTVGGGFALPEILLDVLRAHPDAPTFAALLAHFKADFAATYRETLLPAFARRWQALSRDAASPFESLCVTGCIASGLAAEEGGARFNLFGVNILGIGTLIDSLLAIQALVFDARALSLAELVQQVDGNFPNALLLQRCRGLPGKYGSDTAVSNALARDLSTFIAGEVLASRLPGGVRPYPGFFWFGQDIKRHVPATPDGRRAGERASYGCGPGEWLDRSDPTAILNAAACIDHEACACGNPLTLSLPRRDIAGDRGAALLRQIVTTYFAQGGFHLHFNILDAETLRQAQRDPARYQGLTVRVSGFSARFVGLDAQWQDAIIARTDRGI
jgi:pyruvate-formate lyase